MKTRMFVSSVACGLFLLSVVWVVGCQPSAQTAKVMVLLAGDNGLPAKSDEVALEDIQRLLVTVTQIALDTAPDTGEGGEGEGEGEGEGDSTSEVVVFDGETTIDVRDLTGISALISSMEIPAGIYTKIRLSVKDPELILVSDPGTSITDIQLTANGHLFVSSRFEIPEGQTSLVLLDFDGLHLVQTGGGKYVWTPQLRASVSVEPAQVQATGTIVTVNTAVNTLALEVDAADALLQIAFGGADIFLPEDTDAASGTESDLVAGASVQIEGTLNVEGEMTAHSVRLLGPPVA